MARIRTIKPEFWGSPSHRYADPWVRLFYVALWNWADDTGRGTANPRELAAFAFPDDEDPTVPTVDDVPRLLLEVQERYETVFYKVGGRRYYEVPKWDKHQRNERKAASRHPGPDDGSPYDPGPGDGVSYTESRNFRDAVTEAQKGSDGSPAASPIRPNIEADDEDPVEDRDRGAETTSEAAPEQGLWSVPTGGHGTSVTGDGSSALGTGEQGNRGTDLSVTADAATETETPTAPPKQTTFADFWAVWPRKVAKTEARKKFDLLVRRGADPAAIIDAASAQAEQWRRERKEVKFIPYPATWLSQGRHEDSPDRADLRLVSGGDGPWGTYQGPISPWAQGMGQR